MAACKEAVPWKRGVGRLHDLHASLLVSTASTYLTHLHVGLCVLTFIRSAGTQACSPSHMLKYYALLQPL